MTPVSVAMGSDEILWKGFSSLTRIGCNPHVNPTGLIPLTLLKTFLPPSNVTIIPAFGLMLFSKSMN